MQDLWAGICGQDLWQDLLAESVDTIVVESGQDLGRKILSFFLIRNCNLQMIGTGLTVNSCTLLFGKHQTGKHQGINYLG